MKIKKNQLRNISKDLGDNNSLIVEIAQGIQTSTTKKVQESAQKEIRQLFMEILEVDDLTQVDIQDLLHCLQPDTLLERFAYRKQAGIHATKNDFIRLKGSKGQLEHSAKTDKVKVMNDMVKIKCLHYSVTESNGTVEITIVKNQPNVEYTFGYRTLDDSATAPKDYQHVD